MRLTLEKKTLLMIVVFLVLTIGMIGGIIVPSIRQIQKSKNDTEQLRLYLEKRYERIANLRASLKKIKEIHSAVLQYPAHLFVEGNELLLITTLENLANQNGVTDKINSSNLDKISNHKLTLSIGVSGGYSAVLHYLSDLEALPYFLAVDHLQLSPATGRGGDLTQNGQPQFLLNLDLSLYVSD